jgi:hypothetical protein
MKASPTLASNLQLVRTAVQFAAVTEPAEK